jgi:epoxyqueuosine reductase
MPNVVRPAAPVSKAEAIRARARVLGLDEVRFTTATLPPEAGDRYRAALAAGDHGTMDWLARDPDRRASPDRLWPAARTAIVCGLNYGPERDPLPELACADRGYVSVYARHRDYHDVLKGRLKELAGWIAARFAAEVKVFVDTAPVLEKPLAQEAGLGWQGKHTNLVSRGHGSWLFLGEILTTLELAPDEPERDHCGSCRRCLEVCPTDAFPTPYRLDARRCISYLTIEHKGPIPRALRPLMGNRIYGCDDCLAVCPWNKYAQATREMKLQARPDLVAPHLAELAALDDAAFRDRFSGSPVKRIGRDRFVRNVLVAIGNSGEPALAAVAERLLADPAPLVRGAAVWAAARLVPAARMRQLRATYGDGELDQEVLGEWAAT